MKGIKILNLCIPWIMLALLSCSGYAADQKIDSNSILTDNPDWKQVYMESNIDPDLIEALSYKMEDMKIDVYLGIWCSDSKNNVPPFMKIVNGVQRFNVNVSVNYYSVERKPNKETQYYVEEFKVERVPTFIFYRKDKEIGRIIENPQKSMIEDMMDIIL